MYTLYISIYYKNYKSKLIHPPETMTTTTEPPYHHHHHLLTNNDNPNPQITQKSLLNLLTTKCTKSLQHLKQTHALILKTNHFQDHYISGTLIKLYSLPHFNTFDSSLQVFHQVPNPNVFVWNSTMKACLDHNKFELALLIYVNMVGSDTKPNKFTYPMLFKACMVVNCVEKGIGIHCHVVKNGFMDDMYVKSAAIQMYSSFGRLIEARMVLDYGEFDVVCFNAMVDGYMKCGDDESARVLFESWTKKNVGSWNVMVTGLAKCGRVDEARKVFDEMPQRDEISWSAMIDGCNKNGRFKEALEVFRQMQKEKVELKKFVLSSVALACANIGSLDQGKWIHGYIRRKSIELDVVLGNAILDMYAKLGRLDLAWDVFETMKKREISSWNAMIGALAMHGRAKDAIELFVEMEKQRVKPDEITFVGLLNACAHGGLLDAGFGYFNRMQEVYKIEPTVNHYGCIVDLLGRVGQLAEAEELISTMPMAPSPAVWGALLGACKVHGNVDIGERIGKMLINLEPQNGGGYVLLSNIYAKAGRWEDVEKLRALMKEKGVKTITGRSTIDLNGVLHEFKIGESDHPRIREIYAMVDEMIMKLEVEGYVAKTNEVLFDIDEDEKETTLWRHSEKLAVAFGLISTSSGTPIRVTKNLRMCEDCHSAIKLVSCVYERDIVVRDRLRFHHFRNGKCSCNDFW
ncbi:pentatricopeptide repeat-containing protein At3g62890-like [Rutidosis leptorrhynchoides]|uniref:pentatricopeptide repeat-containing protein At3g62890-like n=1 Tax=Rutidosis leptorrhynchoides TaxID=125765 RepID=UPI003A99D06A